MTKNKIYILPLLLLTAFAVLSCHKNSDPWADSEMWYQSANAFDASKIDVLYFTSTDVLSAKDKDGNVSWQSLLVPEDKAAISGELAWVEQNMFYDDFNFTAPYYHQFTFDAIWQLDRKSFDEVYQNVSSEACTSFDYYMKHMNNGREFVIAGFSQGAMLALDVLKHMTDEQYSRMIACYMLGYRLTENDLAHPHIKAATDEDEKGVVVSFNSTQTREAIWPFLCEGVATCINPVNWTTDSTPATFSFDGTENTVHVDPETHVLLVDTDNPQYFYDYYDVATFFSDAGVSRDCMHHWDLLFYPQFIHDNALCRASAR